MAEYTKFTVASRKDTATGAYSLEDYDRDLRKLRSAIKSALPENTDFSEGNKAVSKSGRMTQAFYIPVEYSTNIKKVLNDLKQKLLYDGGDEKYRISKARQLSDRDEAFLRSEEQRKKDSEGSGEKEKSAFALFSKTMWLKIIALVLSIGETVKRILSSVITLSAQTVKDMKDAHNAGLSYDYIRRSKYIETSHGMKEGTITEAVADIQNKFGNITKLDENALNDLALVMGGKVEDLIKSGIGASDPDKLLGSILDTFNERANAGYNSVGQYVGEQQARRELYSYLLKLSPAWADIFATMQEEQHNINSIFRGQVDTWEKFKNAVPVERDFGATSIDYNVVGTLGQEWGILKSYIEEIKNGILTKLAPSLLSIVRWLENTRFGLSESENRKLNAKNKALNQAELERVSGVLEEMEEAKDTLNPSEIVYYAQMKAYKKALERANKGDSKGNIDNATRTPDEIRQRAIEDLRTLYTSPDNIAYALLGDTYFELRPLKSSLLNPNYEEMKKAVEDYGMDIQPDIKEYSAEVIKNNNAKMREYNKEIETEVKAREKEQIKQLAKEAETKENGFLLTGDTRIKQMLGFLKSTLEEQGLPLPDFLTDPKLTQAQRRDIAIEEGYFTSSTNSRLKNDNWTAHINLAKLINKEAIEELVKQEISVPSLDSFVPEDYMDSDDFWNYLYARHASWFDDKVNGMLIDKYTEESETGNRWASFGLVYDTLKNMASSFGANTYGHVTGYNVNENGETVHRIMLTITDNKGHTTERELGSFKGYKGFAGQITDFSVTTNGETIFTSPVDNSASIGTPASRGK